MQTNGKFRCMSKLVTKCECAVIALWHRFWPKAQTLTVLSSLADRRYFPPGWNFSPRIQLSWPIYKIIKKFAFFHTFFSSTLKSDWVQLWNLSRISAWTLEVFKRNKSKFHVEFEWIWHEILIGSLLEIPVGFQLELWRILNGSDMRFKSVQS